jgi:DNA-binding NtrC family response regulator
MAGVPEHTQHSITAQEARVGPTTVELQPALVVVGGADEVAPVAGPRLIPFRGRLHVGRHEPDEADGAFWVVPDGLVSKRHFLIEPDDGGYLLRDLGSRNGTVVDGALVSAPVKLRDGAVIFVGAHVAVFRLVSAAAREAIALEAGAPLGPVPTASPTLARLCGVLRRIAPTETPILLVGETGTGKEVYARAIHEASRRRGRFVAINCAALPRELIESELFGYVRGAHSQAREGKVGLFEEAHEGTILLDEIGDMPGELQAKLLRFLQDHEVTPLGATRSRRLDVRVVAATSRTQISDFGAGGGLRLDLAMRFGPEPLRLPPLRQRPEDLGALAGHFLRGRPLRFSPAAYQALALYAWPGNVRELEKVIASAAILCDGQVVELDHLPSSLTAQTEPAPRVPPRARPASEPPRPAPRPAPSAAELEAILMRSGGNVLRAAREIDRKPALIYRWCQRYGIDPDSFRGKLRGAPDDEPRDP